MLLQAKTKPSSAPCAHLFYSYSHKDEELREKLDEHLAVLRREGFISVWHDRKIGPGQEWEGQIHNNLEKSDLILLLVSSSFIASNYCYDVEMRRAIEMHETGRARVIPIILRPVVWQIAPFARLQALPRDGKPVVSWRDRDTAFADIAEGIRSVLAEDNPSPSPPTNPTLAESWVLRIESKEYVGQLRAENILVQLRSLTHEPDITLQGMIVTGGSQDSSFEADLILAGPKSAFGTIANLWEETTLSTQLGCAVEAFYPAYGATMLASSSVASSKSEEEDWDLLISPSSESTPVNLKALKVNPANLGRIDFILDNGTSQLTDTTLTQERRNLIDYFYAALTIDEADLWVNLSAYESNRMIPPILGGTQMGRDLLEQDCTLKRFTASCVHPDREPGRSYWEAVHAKAYHLYGTNEIPLSSFQKVWMVPDRAVVYEQSGQDTDEFDLGKLLGVNRNDQLFFVADSYLKACCEIDHFALASEEVGPSRQTAIQNNQFCLDLFREMILPIIERELNSCETFKHAQQIFGALILASAFKREFKEHPSLIEIIKRGPEVAKDVRITSYGSIRESGPVREGEELGVAESADSWFDVKENKEFHAKYMRLFREGVFRCSRRQIDPSSKRTVTRSYFSGGIRLALSAI